MIICFKAGFIGFTKGRKSNWAGGRIFFVLIYGDISTGGMIILRIDFPFVFVSFPKKVYEKLKWLLSLLKSIRSAKSWVPAAQILVHLIFSTSGLPPSGQPFKPDIYNEPVEVDCSVCSTLNRENESIKVVFCGEKPDDQI